MRLIKSDEAKKDKLSLFVSPPRRLPRTQEYVPSCNWTGMVSPEGGVNEGRILCWSGTEGAVTAVAVARMVNWSLVVVVTIHIVEWGKWSGHQRMTSLRERMVQ
jgi:hypothetical protein